MKSLLFSLLFDITPPPFLYKTNSVLSRSTFFAQSATGVQACNWVSRVRQFSSNLPFVLGTRYTKHRLGRRVPAVLIFSRKLSFADVTCVCLKRRRLTPREGGQGGQSPGVPKRAQRIMAFAPVSYTHLDVYKRQPQRTPQRTPSKKIQKPSLACAQQLTEVLLQSDEWYRNAYGTNKETFIFIYKNKIVDK